MVETNVQTEFRCSQQPVGRPRKMWEDSIKMNLGEIVWMGGG